MSHSGCIICNVILPLFQVFQNMWFTPVRERPLDTNALIRKVINITEVVASSSKDMGFEWFETLLASVSTLTVFRNQRIKEAIAPPLTLTVKVKIKCVRCVFSNCPLEVWKIICEK